MCSSAFLDVINHTGCTLSHLSSDRLTSGFSGIVLIAKRRSATALSHWVLQELQMEMKNECHVIGLTPHVPGQPMKTCYALHQRGVSCCPRAAEGTLTDSKTTFTTKGSDHSLLDTQPQLCVWWELMALLRGSTTDLAAEQRCCWGEDEARCEGVGSAFQRGHFQSAHQERAVRPSGSCSILLRVPLFPHGNKVGDAVLPLSVTRPLCRTN